MQEPFAVLGRVALEPDADARALGAAVTLALCGAFEHPGPCPVAPHRTTTEPHGEEVEVRVVGACRPDRRDAVLDRVHRALASGALLDPEGVVQRWRLLSSGPTALRDDERDLAERLAASA
jgi:hypothetical protein